MWKKCNGSKTSNDDSSEWWQFSVNVNWKMLWAHIPTSSADEEEGNWKRSSKNCDN